MSDSKPIIFSASVVDYIEMRTKSNNETEWSQELDEAFKAMQWLSIAYLPELTDQQWRYIIDAYTDKKIQFSPPYNISSEMMASQGVVTLDKLELEHAETVNIVFQCSQAQQFAIMDLVKRYWARDWSEEQDFSAIINKLKKS